MKMKQTIPTLRVVATVFAAVLLIGSLAGCGSGLLPLDDGETETGSFRIALVVPDYDGFGAARREAGAQVVSPETTDVRVILDGGGYEDFVFMERPVVPAANDGVSSAHDGQPMVMEATVGGVPARYYDRVTLELLDSSGGVITTGSAFGIDLQAFQYPTLNFTCFVAADRYDFVTVGGNAIDDTVAGGTMEYYKFYGYKDVTYTITASATSGTPDLYLFGPSGAPIREIPEGETTEVYLAGLYDSTAGAARITHTAGNAGMYVVGVYGYDDGSGTGGTAGFSLTVTGSGGDLDASDRYVQLAYGDMRNQAWDTALENFTRALTPPPYGDGNPSNETAALGYSALRIAEILLDPEMRRVVTDRLGVVGYPTSMAELFSTDWLQRHINVWTETYHDEYGNTVEEQFESEFFLPEISGQWDYDGLFDEPDGIIQPEEKGFALLGYLLSHNPGLNDLIYTVSDSVDRGLSDAVEKLSVASADTYVELTWDMLFDTVAEAFEFGWPVDTFDVDGDGDTGEPIVLVLGRAEINALVTYLNSIQALMHLAQAYNYSLERADGSSYIMDFYELYWSGDGTSLPDRLPDRLRFPEQSPFSIDGLLRPTGDALDHIATAREHVSEALGSAIAAFDDVAQRQPEHGFFVNPASLSMMFGISEELVDAYVAWESKCLVEIKESVDSGATGFIPLANDETVYGYADGTTPWPTDASGEDVVQFNLASVFAGPWAGVVEMTQHREPVWYLLDYDYTNLIGGFRKLSIDEQAAVTPSDEQSYYFRFPASDLSEAMGVATNIASDDPATRFRVEWFDWNDTIQNGVWDWVDDDGDNAWDPGEGEEIYGIGIRPDDDPGPLGSAVDVALLDQYVVDGVVVTPEEYFSFDDVSRTDIVNGTDGWLDSFAAADSPLLEYTDEANVPGSVAALTQYLASTYDWGDYRVHVDIWGWDYWRPLYREGDDLYVEAETEMVWHSVTPFGDIDAATGLTSTGTFWYSWASMMGY